MGRGLPSCLPRDRNDVERDVVCHVMVPRGFIFICFFWCNITCDCVRSSGSVWLLGVAALPRSSTPSMSFWELESSQRRMLCSRVRLVWVVLALGFQRSLCKVSDCYRRLHGVLHSGRFILQRKQTMGWSCASAACWAKVRSNAFAEGGNACSATFGC